jgi:hypothetical protein
MASGVVLITTLYLGLVMFCSLGITVLQIRQQIGPAYDAIYATVSVKARDSVQGNEIQEKVVLGQKLVDIEPEETKRKILAMQVEAASPFLKSRIVSFWAQMPADFIIFFLAVAMGAVGGALSTMRELVQEGRNPKLREYVLRPALGAMVAIAVFTLFKAGQLVISNNVNPQLGSALNLNPFLTAFIGLISGLVAKQAIASVEIAGASFFASHEEQKSVYAREELKKQIDQLPDAEKKMLCSILKVSDKDLANWQDETRPIPKHASEILSAFLHTNKRDLFAEEPKG